MQASTTLSTKLFYNNEYNKICLFNCMHHRWYYYVQLLELIHVTIFSSFPYCWSGWQTFTLSKAHNLCYWHCANGFQCFLILYKSPFKKFIKNQFFIFSKNLNRNIDGGITLHYWYNFDTDWLWINKALAKWTKNSTPTSPLCTDI